MLFPVCAKGKGREEEGLLYNSLIVWRMIVYCFRRWEKHQEGTLIKTGQKARELSFPPFFAKKQNEDFAYGLASSVISSWNILMNVAISLVLTPCHSIC